MFNKIRISYGTAIQLGLEKARQDDAPTTAYLLFDLGCKGTCSFCTRANGNAKSKKLSRISWPEYDLDVVVEKLSVQPPAFKRVCLQTGFNPELDKNVFQIATRLKDIGIKVSASLSPSSTELAKRLLNSGLDHIGIGLDAATEKTYRNCKNKIWSDDWPNLQQLMRSFPGKIEIHLIFGLGDSEEDFLKCVQDISDLGGLVSLFAFTPVNGGNPPDLSAYRRIQCGRYLIETKQSHFSDFVFRSGELKCFGMEKAVLEKCLNKGEAFRTSGCGDCNRPYYNERPGKQFYNYPRPLYKPEFLQAIEQTKVFI